VPAPQAHDDVPRVRTRLELACYASRVGVGNAFRCHAARSVHLPLGALRSSLRYPGGRNSPAPRSSVSVTHRVTPRQGTMCPLLPIALVNPPHHDTHAPKGRSMSSPSRQHRRGLPADCACSSTASTHGIARTQSRGPLDAGWARS